MSENSEEILLKETYGSNGREIFYIKPENQAELVVIDKKKTHSIVTWFTAIFLPQGFPDSVSPDYVHYQIWDTAQAFCSTITGTLATQEVLRGVGVGDKSSSPIAATITWVLKDGFGHVGRIYFASRNGIYLDAYSKKWRLYADCLNDAAICMEMSLPFFAGHTTTMLCLTTMMKAVVGVAGGATRAALTQHHAIRFNMADVAAKDSAQETAVNLIASMVALFILTYIGNSQLIFCIMVILHIVFNYFAVRSVCLRTFNEPRYLQTINKYLKHEIISTPCEINRDEPIIMIGQCPLDVRLCGFRIKLGHSIEDVLGDDLNCYNVKKLQILYSDHKYIVYPNIGVRRMNVILTEEATTEDILKGFFHAVYLSMIICSINRFPLAEFESTPKDSRFAQVCRTIQDWLKEEPKQATNTSNDNVHKNPSPSILNYVSENVDKEWARMRIGLEITGWNLEKHLLVTDEWRIHFDKNSKKSN